MALKEEILLEWFLRELMNEEGLLGKKYDFEVSINGNKKGIFTYDEHISKILLESENGGKKEGPIIRLNSDPLWNEKAAYTLNATDWEIIIIRTT